MTHGNGALKAPALDVRELSIRYDGADGALRPALRGVSFGLDPGDFLVVVGPNGSGKSSLLNALAGAPGIQVAGEIRWHGRSVVGDSSHVRARTVSRVYQDPAQGSSAHLTVREHCVLSQLAKRKRPVTWDRVEAALESAGATLQPDQQVRTLSGGQRQLLTLLLGVLSGPELLLLDEPTASLDRRYEELVLKAMEDYAAQPGHITIFVTHDLEQALRCGNGILVLTDRGEIGSHLRGADREGLTREDLLRALM